jgi:hypothetical protein
MRRRPCGRQFPFYTLEGIDGRFDHVRAVFGGRCNPDQNFSENCGILKLMVVHYPLSPVELGCTTAIPDTRVLLAQM